MVDQLRRAELTQAALSGGGCTCTVTCVSIETEYVAALDAHPDVVLCDHALSGFTYERALQLLHARDSDAPFIIVAGPVGEEHAVEARRPGADDCLLEDRLAPLGPAIASALERRDMRRRALRAAEEGMASEERFGSTFEHAAVGIVHTSLDCRYLLVNKKFCDMTGYTRGELLRMRSHDLMHPDETRDAPTTALLHAENRYVRKDGAPIWVSRTVSPVRAAAGEPLYFLSVIEDISERKRAQQLALLLRATTFAIIEAQDIDAALCMVLQRICELTGWASGQAWLPDASGQNLEARTSWHEGTARVAAFHPASPRLSANLESGLVGAAFHCKKTRWRRDITGGDFGCHGNATASRFKLWAGIPVLAGNEAVGVLEFLIAEDREYDAELVEGVSGVARQLGILFKSKAAAERPLESKEKFCQLAENIPRVSRAAEAEHSESQALERLDRGFPEQGRTDALTQLGNRLRLQEDLEILAARVRRYGQRCCIAMCDIDLFKVYNDTCGRPAGDEVLRGVARTIRHTARTADGVYRYGGEEFLLILPEQSLASAAVAMERIRKAVENLAIPLDPAPPARTVTISVGIADLSNSADASVERVLASADAALYRAKKAGRNNVQVVAEPEA